MNKRRVIEEIETYLKRHYLKDTSGHDWWHFDRVRKIALHIAKKENADLFIVEVAALLHDVADFKFTPDQSKVYDELRVMLDKLGVKKKNIEKIIYIIDNVSFKGAGVPSKQKDIEGKVVQDADRLDALGAIGIARTFAYGGHAGVSMHDPRIKPKRHTTFEDYKTRKTTTVNHFYEKILLIKDRINTKTAQKIAEERHDFTEKFLENLFKEMEGER